MQVESQPATNHLGHLALVNRLWPALAADGGARAVCLSSIAHRSSPVRLDALGADPDAAQRLWAWSARLTGVDAFAPTARAMPPRTPPATSCAPAETSSTPPPPGSSVILRHVPRRSSRAVAGGAETLENR